MKNILVISIFILNSAIGFSQSGSDMPQQSISISGEGGVSIAFTDYKEQKPGPAFRGGLQYFIYPHKYHRIGFGFQLSYQELKGEDNRGTIATSDGIRDLPPSFSTSILSPGIFSEYSYLFSERYTANIRLGFTYNVFNSKDNTGNDAFGYTQGLYNKDFFTLLPEAGIKFRISKNVDFLLSVNYALPVTDYLDDIAASINKDSYTNVILGFSYSFVIDDEDRTSQHYDGVQKDLKETPLIEGSKKSTEDKADISIVNKPIKDIIDEVIHSKAINEFLLPGDELFINGSSRIRTDVYSELDRIAGLIKSDSQSRWRIEAHTDNQGRAGELRRLSNERARAIFDYFVSKGTEPVRLRTYGLSANFPIGDNNTTEGRKINRRIMIIRENPVTKTADETTIAIDTVQVKNDQPDIAENQISEEDSKSTVLQTEETFNSFILRGDDTFDSNSANLKEVAKFLLGEIVKYLKDQPTSKWKIEGHMDNQGSNNLLKKLSNDRAKAVYDYLISEGLSIDQLTYEGFGSSSPIATNNTEEGRSSNRRVLIIRED
jgi:outer membrane protein OmpA-like peptidoglycan-associated protein